MANPHIKTPAATILFIFGGSGDLNLRKLTPALYNLYLDGYLPKQFCAMGMGRSKYSDNTYRKRLLEGVEEFSRRKEVDSEHWKTFSGMLHYLHMDISHPGDYKQLSDLVAQKEEEWGVHPNVVFYLAIAPQLVPDVAANLDKMELCHDAHCTRIVVEKPFGHDLKSARELNKVLLDIFKEEQIYRIDHYLGKETVQNILAMRFANAFFEPVWNRNYIEHIQITNAETVGLEGRGGYYDESGALKDMVQNHLLQLICMLAMEAPVSFDANEIRNKKVDVLRAIRRFEKTHVRESAVRGQYGATTLEGKELPAYRDEKGVSEDSATETFAAVRFYVDNWRWQGVPMYVRTGKHLQEKRTMITVQFKPAPSFAFPEEATETWRANRLIISIQPEMDIRLQFQAKKPGQDMTLNPVDMVFSYNNNDSSTQPEAYETLLLDVMEGNPTEFMRADQIEQAWEIVMPILESWENRNPTTFPNYKPGSWGPEESDALISRDGFSWLENY